MANVTIHLAKFATLTENIHDINGRTCIGRWCYFYSLEEWISSHVSERPSIKSKVISYNLGAYNYRPGGPTVLLDKFTVLKLKEHFEFLAAQKVCGYDPEYINESQVTSLLEILEEIQLEKNKDKFAYYVQHS